MKEENIQDQPERRRRWKKERKPEIRERRDKEEGGRGRKRKRRKRKNGAMPTEIIINKNSLTIPNLFLSLSFSSFSGSIFTSSPSSSDGLLLIEGCIFKNEKAEIMKMNVIKGEKGEIKIKNCSFFIDKPSSLHSSFSPFSLLLPSTKLHFLNRSFKDMTLDASQLISVFTPPPPEEPTEE
jgi:hypothetical protein